MECVKGLASLLPVSRASSNRKGGRKGKEEQSEGELLGRKRVLLML